MDEHEIRAFELEYMLIHLRHSNAYLSELIARHRKLSRTYRPYEPHIQSWRLRNTS